MTNGEQPSLTKEYFKCLAGVEMETMSTEFQPPAASPHPSTHHLLDLEGGDIAGSPLTSTVDN